MELGGSVFKIEHVGNFEKTLAYLNGLKSKKFLSILDKYGQKGCDLLAANTPKRSGATAGSWSYTIETEGDSVSIEWHNSNMGNDGKTPVAILIQMGHGTRTGGYVPPTDFINPVIVPLFDDLLNSLVSEVNKL